MTPSSPAPQYVSTRALSEKASFSEAILAGLAPDGGLYVPETYPTFSHFETDYEALVTQLLTGFGADELGVEAIALAASQTTKAFLGAGAKTPLKKLSDTLYMLELWHGPTLAFKDMAMQMIAPLTSAALKARGETLTLVTATSGDTGAAAVRAFANVAHIRLIVFHPLGRVSPVQRLQMTTVAADNITNIAVHGDFDDCQRLVKGLLGTPSLKEKGLISSVNSINWGRLVGQVPYYIAALSALGSEMADFIIPTGNFGDAFAGLVARKAGANIGSIVCSVNQNDALHRAISTGTYSRTPARQSASVSMDVQAPSNFERLVYEAYGKDGAKTRTFFENFARDGQARFDKETLSTLQSEIKTDMTTEEETLYAIKHVYERLGEVVCPHTAVAMKTALTSDLSRPTIVLSTAHAAKFPDSVERALGFAPKAPDAILDLFGRKEIVREMEADLGLAIDLVASL